MKSWTLFFVLLYCFGAFCAPAEEPTSTTISTVKNADNNGSTETSVEVSVPLNMNIADYYYSIFGKHLDYDYREPIITFDEQGDNALSDEIESEVDKGTVDPWDSHSRKKRFIMAPAAFFNSTRRWVQQLRRAGAERRRLRASRRQQWQQNRIRYLNARSDSLQRQAALLTQLQQRQAQMQATRRQTVRSVSEQEEHRIALRIPSSSTTTTTTTTTKPNSPSLNEISDSVPVL